jgi:hypothetical protein
VLTAIRGAYSLHGGHAEEEAARQRAEESLFLAQAVARRQPVSR